MGWFFNKKTEQTLSPEASLALETFNSDVREMLNELEKVKADVLSYFKKHPVGRLENVPWDIKIHKINCLIDIVNALLCDHEVKPDEIKEGDIVRFKGGVDEYKVKSVDDSLGTFDISPNFFPNEGVYWDGVNKRYFEKVK